MQRSMISRAAAVVVMTLAGTAMAQEAVLPNRPSDPGAQQANPTATSTDLLPGNASSADGTIQDNWNGTTVTIVTLSPAQVDARLADPVQIHFIQAMSNLQDNDRERAAQEIEVVSQFLQIINKGAPNQPMTLSDVPSVPDTIDKLNTLVGEVRSGQADQAQLRKAFAHASLSIAAAQQQQAGKFSEEEKPVAAGYCLRMSASQLRHAIAWSGQSADQPTRSAISSAMQSGQQLVSPTGYDSQTARDKSPSDKVSPGSTDNGIDQSAQTAGARQEVFAKQSQQAIKQLGTQISSCAEKINDQTDWSKPMNLRSGAGESNMHQNMPGMDNPMHKDSQDRSSEPGNRDGMGNQPGMNPDNMGQHMGDGGMGHPDTGKQ